MPDIEFLLTGAAREAPLDLSAVEARGHVLTRRRYAGQAAVALLALALVAVPAVRLLGGDDTSRLRPLEPLNPPAVSTPSSTNVQRNSDADDYSGDDAPVTPGQAPGQGATGAPRQTTGSDPDVAAPSPAHTLRPTQTAQPGGSGSFPRREGCGVTSEGLLPGESRTCRFTATGDGGWVYRVQGGAGMSQPGYVVRVYRGNQQLENPNDTGANCANTGIRPGDRVEVTIRQESSGYSVVKVYAGTPYHCASDV